MFYQRTYFISLSDLSIKVYATGRNKAFKLIRSLKKEVEDLEKRLREKEEKVKELENAKTEN